MKSAPKRPLTELELEIMEVLWDLERGTVREVYEVLLERRRIAYTTVMTMMGRRAAAPADVGFLPRLRQPDEARLLDHVPQDPRRPLPDL